MALRNLFKFRELPESESSKPFLEHLEDLRWTVVKMAITLLVAMVLCFAFRSALVQVMQRPLHDIDPSVGALRALAITDSFTISFRLAFSARKKSRIGNDRTMPALTAMEKRLLLPAI